MSLVFEIETHPTHTIARLIGSAGIAAMGEMERRTNALAAARPALLVLDLSQLDFLASVDLGLLVRLAHALRDHGGRVLAAGARPPIADAIRRTRIDEVVPLVDSVDDALRTTPA